jgi:hypothetical protein
MQKLVTYGLITSLCALLTSACADSDGERPGATGGTGGSAGQTGGGGTGGVTGTGGTGGVTGTGGTGSATPPACSQCVEATVNVTGPMQQAQFIFRQGTITYDMSNALVVWRVRLLTPPSEIPGEQMIVTPYAQNNTPYPGVYRPQTMLTTANGFNSDDPNAWVNVTLDLANTAPVGVIVTPPVTPPAVDAGADGGADAEAPPAGPPPQLDNNAGAFDKSLVFQYGIQVGVLGTYTGTGGNVRIAIDSVTYRTVDGQPITELPDQNFATTIEGLQLDGYMVPGTTGAPVYRP